MPHGRIIMKEEADYHKPSSGSIVRENYCGRLCTLWEIVSTKYRWGEGLYDDLFRISMAVSNVHIKWHPLRQKNRKLYLRVENRLYTIGDEITRKRRMEPERFRDKRRRHMPVQFRGMAQSDDDTII